MSRPILAPKRRRVILPLIAALAAAPIALIAQINLWTNRYDQDRSGANLGETTLTVANVNASRFGHLYSYPVDGPVYAQPLYLSGVTVNGVRRNVVFVATMNDKVYAFDADSASPTPLWATDFTSPPSVTAIPITHILAVNGGNIIGNVGIQGTPVIDRTTSTMYLVARTEENDKFVQRLHALDVTTGRDRAGSPVVIAGSVPGTAGDSTIVNGVSRVTFDPKMHMQRAGLALTNGVVLVAWATHEDITPSRGWIMGFDAATLARVGIVAIEPDSYLGGIWQGGRAPTVDAAGNAYFATGNGKWDGTANFGDSLLKFQVARSGLTLVDYFTPGNEADLRTNDKDLSGSGFTRLPGTNLLLGGGKEGVLYLLDGDNLGHKVANDTQIPQKIPVNGGHVMGGPVYWNSASAGPLVYNWSETDVLVAYRFSNGRLVTSPYAQGHVLSPGHPGGSLTISANGSASNTGIVWASIPTSQDAKHNLAAGILRAFNAETLVELWNSDQVASRDRVGNLMKFVPPVVANGKVFLPNHDNAVRVYGLLPIVPPSGGAAPVGDAYVQGGATASTNFGGSSELRIKRGASLDTTRQTFLKFDVGSPAPAVGRATLRLFGGLSSANSSNVAVTLFGIDDTSWGESTIVWNNKPAAGAVLGGITVPDPTPRWFDVDVTSYVRGQIAAGRRVIGFRFAAPDVTTAYVTLNSREAAANQPRLIVEGASGGAADAYVRGGTYAATNFGADPQLLVKQGASPDTTRESFLKFDLPSSGAVASAVLRLYGRLSAVNDARVVTNAFGVSDTGWQSSTLTWNNRPTGGTALGAVTVVGTTPAWVQLDVTSYVNAEIAAGHPAIAVALRNLSYSTTIVTFNSGEADANRPELILK